MRLSESFINVHTCFKFLDLNLHESQLNTLLLSYELLKQSVNIQFTGIAFSLI